MSNATCPLGITACLKAAETFIGTDPEWNPQNAKQERYVNDFLIRYDVEAAKEILEYIASEDASEINQFLSERGFDIQLDPFSADEFGTASVLDQLVKWLKEGDRKQITRDGKNYDGFKIEKGVKIRTFDDCNPIVEIQTQGKDTVFLSVPHEPLSGFDLYDFAISGTTRFEVSSRPANIEYEGLIAPMVNLGIPA